MIAEWTVGVVRDQGSGVDRDDLVAAIAELSGEERRSLLDGTMDWKHPGRQIQRVMTGLPFAMGASVVAPGFERWALR